MNARKIEDDTPEIAAARARLFEDACASLPPEAVYRQTPATPMDREAALSGEPVQKLHELPPSNFTLHRAPIGKDAVQEGLREAVSVHRMTRAAAERYGFDIPTLEHFGLLADSLSPAPPVDETDRLRIALADPNAVHVNMLRGGIAKPSIAQIIHIYGEEAIRAALADRTQEGEVRRG